MRLGLLPLLLVVGIVSGFFIFRNWSHERERQLRAHELKSHLEKLTHCGSSVALLPDEASYFRLLYALNRLENRGAEVIKVVEDACDLFDASPDLKSLMKYSAMDGFSRARQLGLFEDISSLIDLEQGTAPLIRIVGWDAQRAAVSQIIPAFLAPEAAQHIANLELVPAIVRDARDPSPTATAIKLARTLRQNGVVSQESMNVIDRLGQPSER